MLKSRLLPFAMLLTSFLLGLTVKASQSLISNSYAGEVIEWIDNKDGTSKIVIECMPQRERLTTKDIDNKWLKRAKIDEVLKRLDRECQEALQ